MGQASQAWQIIEALVQAAGLELFDLELPGGGRGALRVFIRRPDRSPVTHDDCAAVSERVLDSVGLESEVPGDWSLEVSSPGVNRRLRFPFHYQGAVGERVKVVLSTALPESGGKKSVITGRLKSFDGTALEVEDEELKKTVSFLLTSVSKARVDYLFAE